MAKQKEVYKKQSKEVEYSLIEILCPKCKEYVPAANININKTIGKCDHCGTIFNFDKDPAFFNERRGRPEMIMPKGTEVLKLRESLDIQVNWFRSVSKGKLAFLCLFGIIWNAIVFPMAIVMVLSGFYEGLLFMSLHLIVGIVMMFWVAAYFLNETNISVNSRSVEISYKPIKLPFRKSYKIDTAAIKQLYVSRYVTNVKKNGQAVQAYGLFALLHNGEKIPILKDMNKETQLYLEQAIERFLDIKDEKIKGKYFPDGGLVSGAKHFLKKQKKKLAAPLTANFANYNPMNISYVTQVNFLFIDDIDSVRYFFKI